MSEIKIKCRSCGKILRLADKPGINNATFNCPVCKANHRVGDCLRMVDSSKQSISNEETQYGTGSKYNASSAEETQYSSNGGEETRFVGAKQMLKIGCLVDSYGHSYQLKLGINTIGRKANTSTASIQIDVTDRTMSRSHAIIEVKNVGGQVLHILRNGANKNPSYLNGTLLESSDQLVLNNGNRIKLGETVLMFNNSTI